MARTFLSLLAVLAVAISSELLTSQIVRLVSAGPEDPVHWSLVAWGVAFGVVGFAVAIGVLLSVQRSPYDFSRSATRNPKRCEVLVLALSDLPTQPGPFSTLQDLDDAIASLPGLSSLGAAAEPLQAAGRFPWVLSLVAIAYHLEVGDADAPQPGPLRRVAVLGSSGSPRNSFSQIGDFVDRLNRLLPPGPPRFRLLTAGESIPDPDDVAGEVIVVDRPRHENEGYAGVDFESIQSVHEAVRKLVGDLTAPPPGRWRRWRGSRLRDVAIDFTGGMKMVSVGAALASLESNAYLQYSAAAVPAPGFVVTAYDYGLTERTSLYLG